jgi:hypothetical protein
MSDEIKIAGNFTRRDWKELTFPVDDVSSSVDWSKAIDIFECRIRKRFLDPINYLIDEDRRQFEICQVTGNTDIPTFGFAILALDCLLAETLQGIRTGITDHKGKSKNLFKSFMSESHSVKEAFGDNNTAAHFFDWIRCELLHRGTIGENFTVTGKDDAPLHKDGQINRTKFHECIEAEFKSMLKILRGLPLDQSDYEDIRFMRGNVKNVFDALCP